MEQMLRELMDGQDLTDIEYADLLRVVIRDTEVSLDDLEQAILNKRITDQRAWKALGMLGVDPEKWHDHTKTYDKPDVDCDFVRYLRAYSCVFDRVKCTKRDVIANRHKYCLTVIFEQGDYDTEAFLRAAIHTRNVFMLREILKHMDTTERELFFKENCEHLLTMYGSEHVMMTLLDYGYVPKEDCLYLLAGRPWCVRVWKRLGITDLPSHSHIMHRVILADNLELAKYLVENGHVVTDKNIPTQYIDESRNETLMWLHMRYPELESIKAMITNDHYRAIRTDHF